MVGEIALLIKGLDTAFNLVQASIKKKKEVQQMGAEISGFFHQKEAIEEKIVEVRKHGREAYIGSPLQEAMDIQNQEDRIAGMMTEIGKEYSRQGKSPQWQKIQRNAIRIQKDRNFRYQMRTKQQRIAVQKKNDLSLAYKILAGLFVLAIGIAGLIFILIT